MNQPLASFGQAFGKVILLGEHAVVYGIPALAAGIERGARAKATPLPSGGPSRLRVAAWEVDVSDADAPELGRAFRALLEATPAPGPLLVEAETDLPPGCGLGCSAAIGVAVARAVDPHVSAVALGERVMAWERVFHGNPSGIDAAVSANGGSVLFRKGEPMESVRAKGGLALCIGNTGVASSTKSMVDAVARLRERRPEIVAKAFEGIRVLVSNARLAIEAGDRFALGRLMDLNQMLLSGLFLSTVEIERMCELARGAGALGAKLTGAGGGGSVVALVPSAAVAEKVQEAWEADGFTGFFARVADTALPMDLAAETSP